LTRTRKPEGVPARRPAAAGLGLLGVLIAALCLAAALSRVAQAGEPAFETAFDTKGEPRELHYRAVFSADGAGHRLEVWRYGDLRLKRRTDDAIETYVSRQPGSDEFLMSILDLRRKVRTRVARSNLYRIGNFTDWFDLAHGLKHPVGPYRIVPARAPAGAPAAVAGCRWYDLTRNGSTAHVCWSEASRLPLVIAGDGGTVLWQVTGVDTGPIPADTFEVDAAGFVSNDANEDIGGD